MFFKWANPGFVFLFIFVLSNNNLQKNCRLLAGFKHGSLEYKASTMTTRPPPRSRHRFFVYFRSFKQQYTEKQQAFSRIQTRIIREEGEHNDHQTTTTSRPQPKCFTAMIPRPLPPSLWFSCEFRVVIFSGKRQAPPRLGNIFFETQKKVKLAQMVASLALSLSLSPPVKPANQLTTLVILFFGNVIARALGMK